jgi:hypothetical protein
MLALLLTLPITFACLVAIFSWSLRAGLVAGATVFCLQIAGFIGWLVYLNIVG